MANLTGIVSDIKRFAVHDGPGIRTTLFLKGCPLRCLWCHNPENLEFMPTLSFTEKLCVGCGDCAVACIRGCHRFGGEEVGAGDVGAGVVGASDVGTGDIGGSDVGAGNGNGDSNDISISNAADHAIDRGDCIQCGACVGACLPGALRIYGETMEASRSADLLSEDMSFYSQSGGGVTFSGGEPLLQPDFCAAVMEILHIRGIHIAVDTCGDVDWGALETANRYADMYLYDIKHIDDDKHVAWTGRPCGRIIDNLINLDKYGKAIELRIPVIPGFNDDCGTMSEIGRLAASLTNVSCVRLLPYHNMSGKKYEAVGLADHMPATKPPTASKMNEMKTALSSVYTNVRLPGEK